MISNLKKWNWTLFIIIMCCAYCGVCCNHSISDIKTVFIIGTLLGLPFGLIWAYLAKDE